jgi:hypothetical protein
MILSVFKIPNDHYNFLLIDFTMMQELRNNGSFRLLTNFAEKKIQKILKLENITTIYEFNKLLKR